MTIFQHWYITPDRSLVDVFFVLIGDVSHVLARILRAVFGFVFFSARDAYA